MRVIIIIIIAPLSSSIRNHSVLGTAQEPLELIVQRRKRHKMKNSMENTSLSSQNTET